MVPSEAVRGSLTQASALASAGFLVISAAPWYVEHHPDVCLLLHKVFCVCVCVCVLPNFPFLQGHLLYWIKAQPNDLILTNYLGIDSLFK